MKISTLHQIARQISRDHRIHAGFLGTINQMTQTLERICENCHTKAQAAKEIAMEVFEADEATADEIAAEFRPNR